MTANRYLADLFGFEAHALGQVETACWANYHFHRAMFRALMRRRPCNVERWGWQANYRAATNFARMHVEMMRESDRTAPRWFRVILTEQPPARVHVRDGQLALVVQLSEDGGAAYARWRHGPHFLNGVDPAAVVMDKQRRATRALVAAE